MVLAMERAFPLLMSPGVDAVRHQENNGIGLVSQLWVQQVTISFKTKYEEHRSHNGWSPKYQNGCVLTAFLQSYF